MGWRQRRKAEERLAAGKKVGMRLTAAGKGRGVAATTREVGRWSWRGW